MPNAKGDIRCVTGIDAALHDDGREIHRGEQDDEKAERFPARASAGNFFAALARRRRAPRIAVPRSIAPPNIHPPDPRRYHP